MNFNKLKAAGAIAAVALIPPAVAHIALNAADTNPAPVRAEAKTPAHTESIITDIETGDGTVAAVGAVALMAFGLDRIARKHDQRPMTETV